MFMPWWPSSDTTVTVTGLPEFTILAKVICLLSLLPTM